MSFTVARQFRLWIRWTPIVTTLILLGARDATAACQNGSASQIVAAGNNLDAIMQASAAPCTLDVAPGTSTAPATNSFTISTGIVVRSTGGASVTTLQVAAGAFSVVSIWPLNGSCPSGVTLEGFTLVGGGWGVFVGIQGQAACPSNQITGVTLRNLRIETASTGHGITFSAVQNSVIDSCTVVKAYANGIILGGSNNNIVMNNTI